MADYTTDQIVERILQSCCIGKYGSNDPADYFAGATNNIKRRLHEHNVSAFLDVYTMFKKEYAQDVLKLLADAGIDIGAEPDNGQDDSKEVYVYKKALFSIEDLVASITLDFGTKCYDDSRYDQLPDTEGIYACLACTLNRNGNYNPEKLIYIGMTEMQGFNKRIGQHKDNDHKKWAKHYDPKKEQLVYIIAENSSDILQSIESALIYKNRPLANSEYMDHYQGEYRMITVDCKGSIGLLKSSITAEYKK